MLCETEDVTQIYNCIYCTLGKVTALGVLCCFALFVCLTLLASFFLPSHLSLCIDIHVNLHVCSARN